jgi:spore maturation protein CgeB
LSQERFTCASFSSEPADGWSLHNLLEQGSTGLVKAFSATYPQLRSHFYDPQQLDLDQLLDEADVVIAHECSEPALLRQLGGHRARSTRYKLLFHDAPHRSLQQSRPLRATLLGHFDGILAASDSLRQLYREQSWADHVWLWRDAVDTHVFRPAPGEPLRSFDVVGGQLEPCRPCQRAQ